MTIRLTFQADGVFESNQVFRGGEALLADLAEAEAAGVELPSFEMMISGVSRGTYQVVGDSLWTDLVESNITIDGTDLVEVLTEFARRLAHFTADLLGVSEEDYPAFEQEAVDEFLAEFAAFDAKEYFPKVNGSYAIEGDTLFITTATEDGVEILELHRIDVASAVARITWGSLKSAWRP